MTEKNAEKAKEWLLEVAKVGADSKISERKNLLAAKDTSPVE